MTIHVRRLILIATRLLFVWFVGALVSVPAGGQESTASESTTLAVGDEAPGFKLTTFGDESISLQQYRGDRGRSVVLTFVRAHW